jgi:hypothetical protein
MEVVHDKVELANRNLEISCSANELCVLDLSRLCIFTHPELIITTVSTHSTSIR